MTMRKKKKLECSTTCIIFSGDDIDRGTGKREKRRKRGKEERRGGGGGDGGSGDSGSDSGPDGRQWFRHTVL